ncbi:MAG: indole-3-glycerol-phosphate synthase [Nitrososphaerota archaeon]
MDEGDRMSFLEKACLQARIRISKGYYNLEFYEAPASRPSMLDALNKPGVSLICELKLRSPAMGVIRDARNPLNLIEEMEAAGADAISIITDPDNFSGSIHYLAEASKITRLPTLMKDFIVSDVQIEAARRAGASAILLIYPAFSRGYTLLGLREAIDLAHSMGLEVILESYNMEDLRASLSYDADLLGVNSRNLDTLELSLDRAYELIASLGDPDERVILESGISSASQIRRFAELGVNKFLVGTSIMASNSIALKIRELKGALRDG